MKDLLPERLDEVRVKSLEEENKIVYFNYLGNLDNFSKTQEKHILKILKGKGNLLLVNKHLYSKFGNFDYSLKIENWTETAEYEKYKPLLKKICSNE